VSDREESVSRLERRSKQAKGSSIQSLDRGLLILVAVAERGTPVPLAELSELLGVHYSSASRLASTLKRRGFLACPSGRKDYILGPTIWRLSREYNWGNMLAMVSHGYLKLLARQTGETAHLAVRQGKEALFIDHVTSNHVIAVSGRTGELVPLHCTAHGKALLADFDERQLRALLGLGPLEARTDRTIVALKDLAAVCEQVRTKGFATDDEEFLSGIRCVAAPVRDGDGSVIGSIGISAPLTRFPVSRYKKCGEQVLKIALRIGKALSGAKGEQAEG